MAGKTTVHPQLQLTAIWMWGHSPDCRLCPPSGSTKWQRAEGARPARNRLTSTILRVSEAQESRQSLWTPCDGCDMGTARSPHPVGGDRSGLESHAGPGSGGEEDSWHFRGTSKRLQKGTHGRREEEASLQRKRGTLTSPQP